MAILVLNSSMNRGGLTDQIIQETLKDKAFEVLHLNDYQINQMAQHATDDQFAEICRQMEVADTVVFATPIYWFDMTGSMKLFLERLGEDVAWTKSKLSGKRGAVLAQGYAPSQAVLDHVDYIFDQILNRVGMEYLGFAGSKDEYPDLAQKL